ncbi:MAG: hypothetical protein JRD93_14385 [Deltaproteobacteria bacterium]|nr:hypothetical protein [Deltaproteobacteria bacterium]MBW2663141.1 hypothetical protein [Deltaproteobacteria bacterium]
MSTGKLRQGQVKIGGSGFGLLDKANHRSSHKGVVPKGGGIGIPAGFLLVLRGYGNLAVVIFSGIVILYIISFYFYNSNKVKFYELEV